jgi:ribosomal protein L37E
MSNDVTIIDINGNITTPVAQKEELDYTIKCPECGEESLVINGHCATCWSCGWSLCSI